MTDESGMTMTTNYRYNLFGVYMIRNEKTGDEREVRCYEKELPEILRNWTGYYLVVPS